MTFGDLFCGCGGFSEGFSQAGFRCLWALDNWPVALKSHQMNHPGAYHILADIENIRGVDLQPVDVLIGSPPCTHFSLVNHKTRDPNKGLELVREFERLVEELNPKYWVWENVPIVKNYYPGASIINTWDFGLSQRRTRAFISNFKGFRPSFTHGELTPLYRYDGSSVDNPGLYAKRHIGRARTVRGQRIRDMESGEYLPPREVMNLQGFPENYLLSGEVGQQQKQIGNAVAPPVARHFAECILTMEEG